MLDFGIGSIGYCNIRSVARLLFFPFPSWLDLIPYNVSDIKGLIPLNTLNPAW